MTFADVSHALAQRVRYSHIVCYLARFGLVLALLRSVPLLAFLWLGNLEMFYRQLITMLAMVAICLPLSRVKIQEDIRPNEVMVITALSFCMAAMPALIPFSYEGLSLIDGLFESVSAITTTGLSTVVPIQSHTPAFLFDRAWMQWCGGLGVVVFSIALMTLDQGVASRKLTLNGSGDGEDSLGSGRVHTRIITLIYSALTLAAIAMLLMAGIDPFSAVTHVFSAISTGGFSMYDASIGAFQAWSAQFLVILCSFIGAVSLPFYYRFMHRGATELIDNRELRGLVMMAAVSVGMLTGLACLSGDHNWLDSVRQSIILGLSAQTTTGFANVDVEELNNASKLTLIFAMLTGGMTGSTAGGIKILRILIVLRMVQLLIARSALPSHAVLEPRLGDDYLEGREIEKALLLVLIFLGAVGLSWLPFLMAGYEPLDALFEVVSACSTTGLSAGITSTDLETGLKWILILDMLLGRVEFMAFLIFLYPRTWVGLRGPE